MTEGTPEKIDALTERLSAYVDGEVSEQEAREIETVLSRNATARRIVAELRALTERVSSLPVEQAPGDMKERVLAALERDALLDAGIDVGAPPTHTGWRVFQLLASAALVAIAVGVGYYVYVTMVQPVTTKPNQEMQFAKSDGSPHEPPPASGGEGRRSEPLAQRERAAQPQPTAALSPARALDATAPAPSEAEPDLTRTARSGEPPASRAERRVAMDSTAARRAASMVAEPPKDLDADAYKEEAQPRRQSEYISPTLLTAQRLDAVPNQVTIQVADAETERKVTSNVHHFLVSNSLIDANSLPKDVQLAPTQQLFTQNTTRLADASEMNQFLVRANPSVVSALLADVQSAAPSAEVRPAGPQALLFYAGGALDRFRKAGLAGEKSAGAAGRELGEQAAAQSEAKKPQSKTMIVPLPGGANTPVTVFDVPKNQSAASVHDDGAALESAAATQAVGGTDESLGLAAPSSAMRLLKPELQEQPVLVLLNIARAVPATQATTEPAATNGLEPPADH